MIFRRTTETFLLGRAGRLIAYSLMACSCFLVLPALDSKIDSRSSSLSDQTSDLARRNLDARSSFGTDEVILVAYTGKDLFDEGLLDTQLDVLEKLEDLPLVEAVSGLPQVYRDLFEGENPEALKEEMLSTPFYENLTISKDASVGAIILAVNVDPSEAKFHALVEGVEKSVQPLRDKGLTVHVVGPPVLRMVIADTTESETRRTFPPAFFCSVLMLILMFRSARATLVALLCMAMTVILTMGIMSLLGIPLNLVTSSLPILLWVLGLSNMIHLIRRYQERLPESGSVQQALSIALRETAMPCAVAVFTTAMGFLSLIVTRLAAIRQLAVWISVGLGLSLVISLAAGPVFIRWLRVPGRSQNPNLSLRWTRHVSGIAFKIGPLVLLISGVLLVWSLIGMRKVKVETSNLAYLSPRSSLVQSCEFVRKNLTGIFSIDAVIQIPSGWLDPQVWPALEALETEMTSSPSVSKVLSPLDMLKKLNQWDHEGNQAFYRLPDSEEKARSLIGLLDEGAQDRLRAYVTPDGKLMRMTVLISEIDSSHIFAVRDGVEKRLSSLPLPLKGMVTGNILRSLGEQMDLVDSQVRSFGWAIATIYSCIFIGLMSWRLTLVSLFPNVMPMLCVFALMAVTDMRLNPVTIMVAGVALGISVEDAIHLLSFYKRSRKEGHTSSESIRRALDTVGPAVAMTTLTACIGFIALARSSFVPIRSFGLLSSLAMMVALANNLFLVPAILTFRERLSGLRLASIKSVRVLAGANRRLRPGEGADREPPGVP